MDAKINQQTAQPINGANPTSIQPTPLLKQIEKQDYKKVSDKLKAVSSENALKILAFVKDNPGRAVGDISAGAGVEQSLTSHHLNKMKLLGILSYERNSKQAFYRIVNQSEVSAFLDLATKLEINIHRLFLH